ncbi:unnamed protein product [Peronospora effusa]|nr:unnamed protein product [Peronospora effusa]
MVDPRPDNGTEDNGDDPGRKVLPPVPLKPQISYGSPQQARYNDWMTSDPHQSDGKLDMDGDRTLSSHSSRISPPDLAGQQAQPGRATPRVSN